METRVMDARPNVIQRFENWMFCNAQLLLVDKLRLDFEAHTCENAALLYDYIELYCSGFEFRWTGVNNSVRVNVAQNGLTEVEQQRNRFWQTYFDR